MASSNPNRKDRNHNSGQQVNVNSFQQQRERSFIRDGNRHGGQQPNFGNMIRPRVQQGGVARSKPSMEIYRPPSLRSGDVPMPENNGQNNPVVTQISGNRVQFQFPDENMLPRLMKSKTSLELSTNVNSKASKAFQTTPPKTGPNRNENNTSNFALQRSKSTGSHTELQKQNVSVPLPTSNSELPDVSQFSEEAQVTLRKVAADPTKASALSVMEAVRHLFTRVVESSRLASSVARYCSYVIEKESNETFLESLLNTCQEWFQERDRLLRSSPTSSQRWVAFMNFLSEMYLQLKRYQAQHGSYPKAGSGIGLPPDLVLLSLLAECCCVTLKQPSLHSLQELECLFFILTGLGRDLEQEMPSKMVTIMAAIRDAFLESHSLPGAAQKTLLQLVELRAAKWQLPATAVTYYYPSVSGTVY